MNIKNSLLSIQAWVAFCCRCNITKLSKKGSIKNIKYVILKHYKQKQLNLQYSSTLLLPNVSINKINDTTSQKQSCSVKNVMDSVSTISSSSKLDQLDTILFSASTVSTIVINQVTNLIILVVNRISCTFFCTCFNRNKVVHMV